MTEVEAESKTIKRETGRIWGYIQLFQNEGVRDSRVEAKPHYFGKWANAPWLVPPTVCQLQRKLVPRDSWTAVCMPETVRVRKITIGTEAT